ncbi:lysozyme [Streptomyces sp. A7024]|uniref:lysozyme n=1 Tax=Streptomyces coryli TaxID=1128680 RepID=A0A6G4TVQ8_9ACTN|nr:GH25 family lysozyme [Streptomyces coryli]NGN63127.1 lysozyme [Streptomyces coryli]
MPLFRTPRTPLAPRRRLGRRRALAATGALAAAFGMLIGLSPGAAAAPQDDPVPLGHAYMGMGVDKDQNPPSGIGIAGHGDGVQGIDVSHWQGAINWGAVRGAGIQFAWMKATEGTTYKDPRFNTNYPAAHAAGVIRGAYHFARPNSSSGATQANFFASNGGAWSRDNLTLPGVLDIENNPSGAACYGLSQTAMRNWILDFYNTYKARTTRDVVIYTSPSWWNSCTGGWNGMATRSPLWVAHWTANHSPSLPGGFGAWTVWQYTSSGSVSGVSGNVDRNKFNGSRDRLLALANNTP